MPLGAEAIIADLRITELSSLAGADLTAVDLLAVADISASETKKVTVKDLLEGGFDDVANGSLSSTKIAFQAGAITTDALVDLAVTTGKIANDAITAAKLADDSSAIVSTSLPAAGDFEGQLHIDSDDDKASYWDGTAWQDLKGKGSVNTITGDTAGIVNLTATANGDTIALTTSLDDTSAANQFLAGPTNGAGTASYRAIEPTDLPLANTSLRGAVIVNGNGLTMDAGVIEIDNTVAAEASPVFRKVAYNAQGLITSSSSVAGADLPVATTVAPGAVEPGTGLTVDGAGVLNHTNVVAAGTVSGITYDTEGHITNATALADTDIPNLPATKITTGTLDIARIADDSVTGVKLADRATAQFGDTQPVAEYIGQLYFNSLSRDIYIWDGNVWQPIGISVGEIVFAGTYDASTNLVASVTSDGAAVGLVVGQNLPAAATANNRYYLVVSEAGTGTGNAPNVALAPPDIILSNGNAWTEIDVSQTLTSVTANQVSFTPTGAIAATNVQAAIDELDTEKLAKAGGTVTGELLIGPTGALAFEGTTDNAYETYLAVVDPTADRTITFPDATGTVVLSGAIVNADVNAAAAITGTKIQQGSTSVRGTVQLTDSTSSTSTTTAATPASVKSAYDLAAAALPKSGGAITGDITLNAQSDLRFADGDSSNWVAFQAPATVPGNVTWTLPATDGTTGQFLSTDGTGTLNWQTPSAGGVSLGLVVALS